MHAGVVCDELEVNPVDHLFSCGHTAGLVAHTTMNAIQSVHENDGDKPTATLVVLDRYKACACS